MLRFVPLALLFLAACEMPSGTGGEPVSARLSNSGLRVTLSDGRVCRGGTPPEGARRWTGPLQNCPPGWQYQVLLDERTNPARFLVEAVLTALTLEDAIAPMAEVRVIDAQGLTTVFASPPPRPTN